jgi:hypothetical protein
MASHLAPPEMVGPEAEALDLSTHYAMYPAGRATAIFCRVPFIRVSLGVASGSTAAEGRGCEALQVVDAGALPSATGARVLHGDEGSGADTLKPLRSLGQAAVLVLLGPLRATAALSRPRPGGRPLPAPTLGCPGRLTEAPRQRVLAGIGHLHRNPAVHSPRCTGGGSSGVKFSVQLLGHSRAHFQEG